MANILVTGIATLDIINEVPHYPREDEELRASGQQLRRGGNASNTCSVLVQLGSACHLACTLADDAAGQFILSDIRRSGIQYSAQMILPGSATPTSYITLNTQNGSRTIVHYRDLQELSYSQFDLLDLSFYDWFHFEARNTAETEHMMHKASSTGKTLSLEVEKQRPQLERLMTLADIIMFSRAFAEAEHFTSATQCLEHYAGHFPEAMLTCTWGAEGAYALHHGELIHSSGFAPPQIVDTIGAGDTFNAALIHSLSNQKNLATALEFACRLAGKKCGQSGFDQLGNNA